MFQSTPTGFPAGDRRPRQHLTTRKRFQSTPTGFPAGDLQRRRRELLKILFQSTPTGFPAGDDTSGDDTDDEDEFQSTPTGFPAGDQGPARGARPRRCFNPRRPVSRPATTASSATRPDPGHDRFNPRRPVSRPATRRRRNRAGRRRFNPRRPVSRPATWRCGPRPGCGAGFNPRRPVSRPATTQATPTCRAVCRFNPRRPVSRPATYKAGIDAGMSKVSIHADRFPGRRLDIIRSSLPPPVFQSTPTGFPAGDAPRPAVCQSRPRCFNPRRPVSRPATDVDRVGLLGGQVSIHADRFPGRRQCWAASRCRR